MRSRARQEGLRPGRAAAPRLQASALRALQQDQQEEHGIPRCGWDVVRGFGPPLRAARLLGFSKFALPWCSNCYQWVTYREGWGSLQGTPFYL